MKEDYIGIKKYVDKMVLNVLRKIEDINNNEDDNNYKFGKSSLDYGIESNDLNIKKRM